ncbi:MAE_28990/MAE_18760 family HEPN-like nuclease [Methylophilus sp. 'Pure River']|uniref:MAE_28990/MAE_18760 family HEPN-like nuclease n=1 Tax=Methylophilus sp. 'Pure River' TaxID=3377117 RepID=UPI00398E63D1
MTNVLEEIVESNKWRENEFTKFKLNSENVDSELWCRMCVPMIYAHWEGFVVSALKIVITHLNTLELISENTSTNLLVLAFSEKYKTLSGKQSFGQRVSFTNEFKSLLKDSIKITTKINTKSNLNKAVLEELCATFNFNFQSFNSDFLQHIDRLVNIRNSIAHGENSFVINQENIENYITAVRHSIDTLSTEIKDFLDNQKYLLVSASEAES